MHSIVQGPAKGSCCPMKSMLVTPKESKSGNEWMKRLRSEFQYPETLDPAHFGEALIRTAAKEKSLFKNMLEKLGKSQTEDTPRPRIVIRDLVCPVFPFDDKKSSNCNR